MSHQSQDRTREMPVMPAPPPPAPPHAPAPPPGRGDGGWSPGTFTPAIFLVALLVIGLLVGVAALSRRAATARPTATAAAATGGQPTASAPARGTGKVFVVGNTGGQGVYLRHTPRLDDRDTAYGDGTRLEQIDADVTANGLTWRHVRAPDGKVGWVPAQYTAEGR
jgi:hypothetical protein